MTNLTAGTLYGIGIGPGDPELLTLKGLRVLRSTPVVFVPVSEAASRSYALDIASEHIDAERQRIVTLRFAMRSDVAAMARQWRSNAEEVLAALNAGVDASFLTEGDPSLYSTFTHVAETLRGLEPSITIVTIPGVASPNAAASAAGIALTDGEERLTVLPAAHRLAELPALLRDCDTLVLMKVAPVLEGVLDAIEAAGRTAEAVCVVRCGRPEQQVVRTVMDLRGHRLDYFSLIIVRRGPCP